MSTTQCHHPVCWLGRVTPQVTTTLFSLPWAWRVRRRVRDNTEHPPLIAPSPRARTARVSEEEEEERVDMVTEEAALKNIQEQLQGREKELIEELPDDSPPGAVLANSLIAVGNLSTCPGHLP
ncbi:unnamed protein product [Caretta caretta]